MAHRLLAVNVFARADGVQRLRNVQPVRRGDADDIHVRVRQQLLVLHVGFGAGGLSRLIQPVSVNVTDGHHLRLLPTLNQPPHRRDVARPAPADADEADADGIIGAEHASAGDIGRRA